MISNPKLFEINTRVWIKQFGNINLSQIPMEPFKELLSKGFNMIWLMGIWKNSKNLIDKCCFSPELISAYDKSLKDWQKEDVHGSPYSIEEYTVNPELGTKNDLLQLKEKLNSLGLKLILDFIPNHFAADTPLLETDPYYFLQSDEESIAKDSFTFFRSPYDNNLVLAHGRDPLFPAWTDTVQVNFFNPGARAYLIQTLNYLTELCDGVRCDMAMLPLNNVFHNTWMGVLNKTGAVKPVQEFWSEAISDVKSKSPSFIFIGEAYWDLEWDLQQLGFDFTYDKRLLERLSGSDLPAIKAHLSAEKEFQLKSVRFIENHDEPRAVAKLGKYKSLAAAAVMSTIRGLKLYHNGQFEGKKVKLPLQLRREPAEKVSNTVKSFYDKLFSAVNDPVFVEGEWTMLETGPANGSDNTCSNFLAWEWELNGERRIVVINYSETTSQCRIKLNTEGFKNRIVLADLMSDQIYERNAAEIQSPGLYISLKAYHTHIFKILQQ